MTHVVNWHIKYPNFTQIMGSISSAKYSQLEVYGLVYLFISTRTEDFKVSPSVLAGAAPKQQMSPSGAGCFGGAGSSFEMASGRAGGVVGVGTGGPQDLMNLET